MREVVRKSAEYFIESLTIGMLCKRIGSCQVMGDAVDNNGFSWHEQLSPVLEYINSGEACISS